MNNIGEYFYQIKIQNSTTYDKRDGRLKLRWRKYQLKIYCYAFTEVFVDETFSAYHEVRLGIIYIEILENFPFHR